MTVKEWPNKLGWDVNGAEVWRLASGTLRVVTASRYANVQSTSDPIEAYRLTQSRGLLRRKLAEMQPWEANAAVLGNVL